MAALSAIRSAFAGISPRDRRVLLVLGVVVAVLLTAAGVYWLTGALDDLETERAQLVDALRVIRAERPRIAQRRERRRAMAARYAERAPALTSFVETAAREAEVTVSEAVDRPSLPAENRRFQRRAVSIRLRRVNLQSLVSFMDRIESAEFPVAITGIRIRKRFGESNSYDVDDMVISTWDRVGGPEARPPATAPAPAASARAAGSGAAPVRAQPAARVSADPDGLPRR